MASGLLPLGVEHLPLCLWGGKTLNGSWLALLLYLLRHTPLCCEPCQGHQAMLEPSDRKGPFILSLFFFFFGLSGDSMVRIAIC